MGQPDPFPKMQDNTLIVQLNKSPLQQQPSKTYAESIVLEGCCAIIGPRNEENGAVLKTISQS